MDDFYLIINKKLTMNELITELNDVLWGYLLVGVLIACGLWFTWRTRFVQFRMVGEMLRLLGDQVVTSHQQGQQPLPSEVLVLSSGCG